MGWGVVLWVISDTQSLPVLCWSLSPSLSVWPAMIVGFSFYFSGARCVSQRWWMHMLNESECVSTWLDVCMHVSVIEEQGNTLTRLFSMSLKQIQVHSPLSLSVCPLYLSLCRWLAKLLSSVSCSPPGLHEFNWGQAIPPWKVSGRTLRL